MILERKLLEVEAIESRQSLQATSSPESYKTLSTFLKFAFV
jgi:hypothetical protein